MVILSLLVSACSAQPTEETTSAEDISFTAFAAALTIIAETQAAIPTNTPFPPTETASPTPLPTDTPIPSPTFDPLLATNTITPSSVSQSEASPDPCNQHLSSWQGESVSIVDIAYEYTPQGKDDYVVVSLWVMTDLGECGFLSDLSTGPVGQYSAYAFIDGAKSFKVSGGFRLSPGSWKLVIRNDRITALGGCYPNC